MTTRAHKTERFKVDKHVWITIDWDAFIPGTSVFIPVLNVTDVTRRIYGTGRVNTGEIDTRVAVENGIYGVRVWRLK